MKVGDGESLQKAILNFPLRAAEIFAGCFYEEAVALRPLSLSPAMHLKRRTEDGLNQMCKLLSQLLINTSTVYLSLNIHLLQS